MGTIEKSLDLDMRDVRVKNGWTMLKSDMIAIHGMTDSMLFELNGEDCVAENDMMQYIIYKIKDIVEKYR